jgi:hypothetical protein
LLDQPLNWLRNWGVGISKTCPLFAGSRTIFRIAEHGSLKVQFDDLGTQFGAKKNLSSKTNQSLTRRAIQSVKMMIGLAKPILQCPLTQ